jgi:hypothetical protein
MAGVDREVLVDVSDPPTIRSVVDALESRYPVLKGTIRDHGSVERRAFIRFFACGNDLSHKSPDAPLPESVVSGQDVFRVVGAIAGG